MSLEFTDFAHYYTGSGMTEDQQREDFEVYACFMESLVRYFWRQEPRANSMGISFDKDTMALVEAVDSNDPLRTTFNDAACENAARKTGP